MTKKILTSIVLIILILSSFIIPKIYADNTNIVSVPTKEIKQGEKLKVYINIENIKNYTLSEINLITDIYLEPVIDTADTGLTSENSKFDSSHKKFTIQNIPEGIKTICVIYTIPNYIANNTKIKLTGIIVDDKEKEQEKNIFEITVKSDEVSENNNDTNNQNDGVSENKEQDNNNNTNNQNEEKPTDIEDNQNSNGNNATTMQPNNKQPEVSTQTNTENSNRTNTGGLTNTMQAVTYKGSRNNYLSSIAISGYEIEPIFNKTNNTYFLTVGNDVSGISITATREETSATVTISGNTNLKEGLNKVLISVLAQNGDVRYYRIYVTKGV